MAGRVLRGFAFSRILVGRSQRVARVPEESRQPERNVASNRVVLVSVGVAAVVLSAFWFTCASPQARYYRAENARRDTVEWLAALSDSAGRAIYEVNRAAVRFDSLRHRLPRNSGEWRAAGLDSARLLTTDDPTDWLYRSEHNAPRLRGEEMGAVTVGIQRLPYGGLQTRPGLMSLNGGRVRWVSCDTRVSPTSPPCAFEP